jgi:hypothetical protein
VDESIGFRMRGAEEDLLTLGYRVGRLDDPPTVHSVTPVFSLLLRACLRRSGVSAWSRERSVHGGPMARRTGYPLDLSDQQWELIEPLLPAVKTGGRPEKHPRRAIVVAILYVVRTRCW